MKNSSIEKIFNLKCLADLLIENNITHKTNPFSGSIGKRYSRSDEIGIPFAITVDYDSLKEPYSVTIGERDSMEQIRVNVRKY